MSSDWDLPDTYRPNDRVGPARNANAPAGMDPLALVRFVLDNFARIVAITILLTAVGIAMLLLASFPYRATATVLVDPRDQRVTLQEDVLQPIGSDAAVLESMVQIMRSDGFLLSVMDKLGLLGSVDDRLSEEEQLKALAKFKGNLSVERKGATYLVEITYKASTAEEAARIANSVANEFADAQNASVRQATEAAARALSERLVELRRKLNASEKAVADFAAEHGILYVDDNNTLQMRQLTELSAQLAAAKNETEAARARYQKQIADGSGDVVLSGERDGEPAQLSFLRQQRAQLKQQLEQLGMTYGSRHPRIAQARQALDGIDRQIRDERQTLTLRLKGELDVAEARLKKLQDDVAGQSSGAVTTDAAKVRLEALRREAAADRDIYEKFLARNKTTDELALISSDNVRVVSPAVPPLRSSRPSLVLVAPVFGLLAAVAATTGLAIISRPAADRNRRRRGADRITDDQASADSANDGRESAPAGAEIRVAPSRNAMLMIGKERQAAESAKKAHSVARRASNSLLAMAGSPDERPSRIRRGSGAR